jgi:hypothetical protein
MRLSPSGSGSFRFVPLHVAVARQQPVASAGGAADPAGLGCRACARSASGRPRTRSFSRPRGTTIGSSSVQTLTSGRCSPPSTIPGPSVVLVRRVFGRRVEELAGILIANLPQVEDDLRLGSIVVIGDDTLRIRRLPIG